MPGPEDENLKKFDEIEERAQLENRQLNQSLKNIAEKAMKQKNPKTAIYTAEGKFFVREARESIKKLAGDYRNNVLASIPQKGSEEYKESFYFKVEQALDNLELAEKEIETYVSENTPSAFEVFTWCRQENVSYRRALRNYKKAFSRLEEAFMFTESDKDDDFRKLYVQTVNMVSLLESLEKGNLNVPAKGTRTENGKKIHFVDASDITNQPLADLVNENNAKIELVSTNDSSLSDKSYVECHKEMLFPHDPCPEDVCQGRLGNCYMLSMLSGIAAADPQFIKDSMVDNGKTVTVRFYNKSHEPVYVTVDKSVPGNTDNGYYQIYSKGPLWVKMMEKAFAASGLMKGKLSEAEKGEYKGRYSDLNKGYAMDFLTYFVGKTYQPAIKDGGRALMIPRPGKEQNITRDELDFISDIIDALNGGNVLYAGAKFNQDDKAIQDEKLPNERDFIGIFSDHAHSIHGIVEKNNRWYIRVRNPHGHKGRVYDDTGKPYIDNDANGYNLVDVKVFGRYFDTVEFAELPLESLRKKAKTERDEIREMYGDAVMMIESALRKTDAFYLKFNNSPEFDKMRKSSARLKELLLDRYPKPNSINNEFKTLFKSAEAYLNYRDTQVRKYEDELSDRAVNRYQMAEVIKGLEKIFINNPERKKVKLEDITKVIAEKGDRISQAKKASLETFNKRKHEKEKAEADKAKANKDANKATDKSKVKDVRKMNMDPLQK